MALLAGVLLFVWALSACGTGGGQKSASGGGDSTASGGSSAGAGSSTTTIKLTLFDRFLETDADGSVIAHRQMIEEFKKEHPNVEISEESLQDATYKTKIKALAAGQELPDVFEMIGSDAEMFLNNNLIKPINEFLESDPEWKDGFIPSTLNDFTINGVVTGAPLTMLTTSLVYYNKAIFDEVGIEKFPETWDEFLSAIETLKANGYIPIALGNKDKWVAESCILSALGDRYTGTEWFYNLKNRQGAKFTDQPFVDALAALQELGMAGAFNSDVNSIDNGQHKALYYNKKAAMFIEGDWAISVLAMEAPQDVLENTRLAILPSVNGGAGSPAASSGGAAWSIAINANLEGEKLEMALELVKKLTSPEKARVMAEHNSVAATKTPDYDESKVVPLFKEYLDLSDRIALSPIYDAHLPPAVIETMNNGLQALIIQAITPEQLAQDIQKTFEELT
jgi:raffinose/stachyose/melibiose transport system substrate-binding protein